MSIFLEQHHDKLLLEYLSIDDLVVLSQVSKYYRNLTKGILQPFHEFFNNGNGEIRIKLSTNKMVDIFVDISIDILYRNSPNSHKYKHLCLLINACIYNNFNVIKYILNKHIFTFSDIIIINTSVSDAEEVSLHQIIMMISIYNNNIDMIKYLRNNHCYDYNNLLMEKKVIQNYTSQDIANLFYH